MRTSFTNFVLIIVVALLATTGLFAQDLVVNKTTTPPVIDGSSADAIWGMVEANIVANPYVGEPEGDWDSQGSFKMLWDDTFLYFVCDVMDDALFDDSEGVNEHDESFDLFIDPWFDGGDSPQEDDILLTLEWAYDGNTLMSGEKGGFTTFDTTGLVSKCMETEEGYTIEAAIPIENLMVVGGDPFGFDLRINDDDDGDSRDTQVAWHATDLNDWNRPGALAELLLSPEVIASAVANNTTRPEVFSLEQNYPNPFNPSTTISFSLAKSANVTLTVYNTLGEQVDVLVNEVRTAGAYSVQFDASSLSNGIYFYQLQADNYSVTKSMLLVK